MRIRHVVLTDETGGITSAELNEVAAALQIQVERDLAPAWGTRAIVTAGVKRPSAWPIRITEDVPEGALGVHLDDGGDPYAVILPDDGWPVTASHELVEMLVDPRGSRMSTAPSLDPAANGRLVHFLVEVGDPVETESYTINGINVSNFVFRDYYHRKPHPGDEYDLLATVERPYQVLPGGYISWYDPHDGRWHQVKPDGSIVTAGEAADLATDFRDSRDKSFSDDEDRHNLLKILASQNSRPSMQS